MQNRYIVKCSALMIGLAVSAGVLAETAAAPKTALPGSDRPLGEGTLARTLFGNSLADDYGIEITGLLDVSYARNNRSDSEDRKYGQSNLPVIGIADEGWELGHLQVFVNRAIKGTFVPRIGPKPGLKPEESSFGFTTQVNYGRNSQAAGTFGWDKHWGLNDPGDDDPLSAKRHRQKFFAVPNLAALAYVPYGPGINAIAGIFGPAMGYEIPPNVRMARNAFASKTYAFATEPGTVAGFMLGSRLMNDANGIIGLELGAVQGWSNLRDNNSDKSLIGAFRYRTPDMSTWIDYEFIVGNEQNDDINDVQAPVSRLISPDGQLKQQHSLNGWHKFNSTWSMGAELVYGRQDGDGKRSTVDVVTGPGFGGAEWWGVNGVLTYTLRPDLSFSARAEHFEDPDGYTLFPASRALGSFNAVTVGARHDLNKYISVRPELRYDWFDAESGYAGKPFVNGSATSQLSAAVELLVYF